VHLAVDLRKQRLSPSIRTSKATASTVIATGNPRQGRLMADHGGLYSTTELWQIEAKGGSGGMRARCFSYSGFRFDPELGSRGPNAATN
jgi:hypothetical protein